jgi:predicted ArsR family transcriptional regulator
MATGSTKRSKREAGSKLVDNRVEAHLHHLRRQILSCLTHMGPSSPSRLAKVLDERTNDVNYHMKRLVELGCAELVEVETFEDRPPVKIYRATERYLVETQDWDGLPQSVKEGSTGETGQLFIDDMVAAIKARTLGVHPHHALIQQRLAVDQQGLEEAVEIAEDAMQRFEDLQVRVLDRLSGETPTITMSALTACFELPPSQGRSSA